MKQETLVLYHGDCPSGDGFAAALAAWLALKDAASYVAVDYASTAPLPAVENKDVYVLDFHFEPDVLQTVCAHARSLTLLDHHKAAKDRLVGRTFQCACHAPARLLVDTSQSGCVLAWRHFHPTLPLPALFKHIQDRDLWRWELPDSRAFLARLDLEPKTFEAWSALLQQNQVQAHAFLQDGALLGRQRALDCERMAKNACAVNVNGVQGLMVNATHDWADDVGNLLAKQCNTFGLVWFITHDRRVKCSLRTLGQQVDANQMARPFGGSGHKGAAGFYLPASRLGALLEGSVALNPQ